MQDKMEDIFVFSKIITSCLIVFFCSNSIFGQASTEKLNVLIVDGFSNHDWKQTSKIVTSILEKSELFEVSVSTAPSKPDDEGWESWNPIFGDYDVVIQNSNNIYNKNIRWPRRVGKALEVYVKNGGGLYILHSANNAFSHWEEYNLMIGLGWRSEKQGVALQIKENEQILKIPIGEGRSTYHGPRNDEIIYKLNNHPINKDFPNNGKPQIWNCISLLEDLPKT